MLTARPVDFSCQQLLEKVGDCTPVGQLLACFGFTVVTDNLLKEQREGYILEVTCTPVSQVLCFG